MRINPRLYQAMELLYMPMLDLEQYLKQEVSENPMLELGEADVEQEVELKDDDIRVDFRRCEAGKLGM
jgi:RNA polymerase sigma-54 factor